MLSPDLLTQVRVYTEQIDAEARSIEELLDDVLGGLTLDGSEKPSRARPGWVVALAAAVAVLLIIGGVTWLVGSMDDDRSPVITEPSTIPTTTAPLTNPTAPPVTAATTAPPTTAPPTSASPASLPPALRPIEPVDISSWAPIEMSARAFIDGDTIEDVVVGGPGLVAVGWNRAVDGRLDAAVWTSPDGLTWDRVPHDEALFGTGSVMMSRALAVGPGLLAFGFSCDDPEAACPSHPQIWVSADGTTWERVPWDPGVFGAHTRVSDVIATPSGFLAVGASCTLDSDEPSAEQWDDFVSGRAGDVTDECPFAVWTSLDGRDWVKVYQHSDPLAFADAVAWTGTQYVAVGGRCCLDQPPLVWTSVDGMAWNPAEVPSDRAGGVTRVIATDSGLVATGVLVSQTAARHPQMAAWASPDGSSWTLVYDEGRDSTAHDLSVGGRGFVAVGSDGETGRAAVWASSDGVTWSLTTGTDSGLPEDGWLKTIVAAGDRVIVVAMDHVEERTLGIWVAPPR